MPTAPAGICLGSLKDYNTFLGSSGPDQANKMDGQSLILTNASGLHNVPGLSQK